MTHVLRIKILQHGSNIRNDVCVAGKFLQSLRYGCPFLKVQKILRPFVWRKMPAGYQKGRLFEERLIVDLGNRIAETFRSSLSEHASGSNTSDRGEVGSRNLPALFMLLLLLLSLTAASYSLPPSIRPSPVLLMSSSSFDTFLHFVMCFSARAFSVSSNDSESESLYWASAASWRSMSSVLPSCCRPPPNPPAAPPPGSSWPPLPPAAPVPPFAPPSEDTKFLEAIFSLILYGLGVRFPDSYCEPDFVRGVFVTWRERKQSKPIN
uniref:Uncharacterized protein n=1 Tax=Anopheles atroparvus TaxID=41427 RepID=A0A182IX07_ANOAO